MILGVGEDVEHLELTHSGREWKQHDPFGNRLAASAGAESEHTLWPAIPLPALYPTEKHVFTKRHTLHGSQQPTCSSTAEWTGWVQYIRTVEYYKAMRLADLQLHTIRMTSTDTILS